MAPRNVLFRFYWWWERRIVPGLRSSQYVFADVLTSAMGDRSVWLDIGCGRRPFPDWMADAERRLLGRVGWAVGIDLDLPSLRDHDAYRDKLVSSADRQPFGPAAFDVASANMVVEHLEDPGKVLREVRRTLRPGGRFVFHTPNRRHWPLLLARLVPERPKRAIIKFLDGRATEDVFSTHYHFNDVATIERLAEAEGFRVESLRLVSGSAVMPMLGPLVLLELLWIRLVQHERAAALRSNIIGVLRVTENAAVASPVPDTPPRSAIAS